MRALRRHFGFSTAAVLLLALGIGASTAVFSIADTVFLRPLPYRDPAKLVWVAIRFPSFKAEFLPSPDYVAWRRDIRVFEQLAATQASGSTAMVLNGPDPVEVHAARVSFNFLSVFRIAPMLGRSFQPAEELPNGPKAVLLTDRLWRNRFASRKDLLGRNILLDAQPYTVIGILPASFIFPMDVKVDLLTTLPVDPTASHHARNMSTWAVFGRLRPGISVAEAQANIDTLFAASKADMPIMFRSDTSAIVQPLQQHRIGSGSALLPALAAAVGCLLLIACANVANLLLARWSARSRELAIRAAMGASRARIVRQLLAEAALMSFAGCLLGMIFVVFGLRAFVHFAAAELPRLSEVTVDARVFGIAVLVSALTTILFGGLPAVRAGGVDILSVLQRAGKPGIAGGHRVLRFGLVSIEIALSLVLVCGAALLLETLWHLENDHLGFQPEHVLTVSIPIKSVVGTNRNRDVFAHELLDYVRHLPGTEAAAGAECTPLSSGSESLTFARSDRPLPEAFHRGDAIGACGIGPDFFKTANMSLIRGRSFTEQDFAHPGTLAVINEAAAQAYFPSEDPIGRQIGGVGGQAWKTVIGVVSAAKNHGLNLPPAPEMFINDWALYSGSDLILLVRGLSNEQALAAAVREKLHSISPGLFAKFETLDQAIGEMSSGPKFNSVLLASFAVLAFVMAVIGIYSVLAYAVAQRTQEMGIRMALGAEPRQVLALILGEGAELIVAGSVAGLGVSLFVTGYLKSLLYGVAATDPRTYIAVIAGLGTAGLLAALVPARRAAMIDPVEALHQQ